MQHKPVFPASKRCQSRQLWEFPFCWVLVNYLLSEDVKLSRQLVTIAGAGFCWTVAVENLAVAQEPWLSSVPSNNHSWENIEFVWGNTSNADNVSFQGDTLSWLFVLPISVLAKEFYFGLNNKLPLSNDTILGDSCLLAAFQFLCTRFFISSLCVNNSVSQPVCGKSLVLSCFALANRIRLGQWKWYQQRSISIGTCAYSLLESVYSGQAASLTPGICSRSATRLSGLGQTSVPNLNSV